MLKAMDGIIVVVNLTRPAEIIPNIKYPIAKSKLMRLNKIPFAGITIKSYLLKTTFKTYPVINSWVDMGVNRPSIKISKLEKLSHFLSPAPIKRLVLAISVLEIRVSKKTTVKIGIKARNSP